MESTVELYLDEDTTSKRIDVSKSALRKWRRERRGPRYVKLGRLVRYSILDLNDWLRANTVGGESPEAE